MVLHCSPLPSITSIISAERYTLPAHTEFRLPFLPILANHTLGLQEALVQIEFVHALEIVTKAGLAVMVEKATFTFVLWKALINMPSVHTFVHMALL